MYKLKLFNDPFISDFFELLNEGPNFVDRMVKRTNYKEDDDEYCVEIAVPGISKEDLSIKVKDMNLFISYEKKESNIDYSFTDSFSKEYILPADAVIKDITAKVDGGILTLKIPKDKKNPKEVNIKIL